VSIASLPPSSRPFETRLSELRAIDNHRLAEGPLTKLSAVLMTQVHEGLAKVLDLDQESSYHGVRRWCYPLHTPSRHPGGSLSGSPE